MGSYKKIRENVFKVSYDRFYVSVCCFLYCVGLMCCALRKHRENLHLEENEIRWYEI